MELVHAFTNGDLIKNPQKAFAGNEGQIYVTVLEPPKNLCGIKRNYNVVPTYVS